MTKLLPRAGLFAARFCTSAWIGAAALFVVVGVSEVIRGGFDSAVKDQLVAIRFPAFYVCGASLISLAWVGTCLAGDTEMLPRGRRRGALLFLTVVLALMAVDYLWIYLPLHGMVTPPGQVKPDSFRAYHDASKWINIAGLMLCLVAAALVNWPARAKE